MATGTVSSINQDNWQLIGTNSPTSGTSTSFTGLSGYKKYMLVWAPITFTASTSTRITATFNADSTSGNYASVATDGVSYSGAGTYNTVRDTAISLSGYTAATHTGYLIIDNANQAIPKVCSGQGYSTDQGYYCMLNGVWLSTSTITSIELNRAGGSQTISSGTIKLYGIAV
jgi:hypothetical protein